MRIAVVVQRFGKEVIGGAERLAREVALRLAERHRVEVWTTCALDYRTWANRYPAGRVTEKGALIHRYPTLRQRSWRRFGTFSALLYRFHKTLPTALQWMWLEAQGPYAPKLVEDLEKQSDQFDRFLFFTYLYFPTVRGLPPVGSRAVLVPAAHREPAIRFAIYRKVFGEARAFVFLTAEERSLVHSLFPIESKPFRIVGLGVHERAPAGFDGGFLLYIGRIEKGKNCEELFRYVRRAGVPLVAAGPAQTPVPDWVDYRGVVSETEKQDLLSNCRALVVPSRFESLSIVALEAWACGKPVIVNRRSAVLTGQVERSEGGLSYRNFGEFQEAFKGVDRQMGLQGREYVRENYHWGRVLAAYEEILRC